MGDATSARVGRASNSKGDSGLTHGPVRAVDDDPRLEPYRHCRWPPRRGGAPPADDAPAGRI